MPIPKTLAISVLKKALRILCYEASSDVNISLSFVSKSEIKKLNKTYRKKDKATDVLSFPQEYDESFPFNILGDIVICPEIAKKQAEENGITQKEEIADLIIHGLLHLHGLDHEKTKWQYNEMLGIQKGILHEVKKIWT